MNRFTQNRPTAASVIVFLLPALALTTSFGLMLVQVLMLLAVVWRWNKGAFAILRENFRTLSWFLAGFVGYFLVSLLRVLIMHHDGKLMDRPSRFLIALSCIAFITYFKPPIRWFWKGLCAGAIAVGVLALVQRFGLHIDRVEGFTHHAITFGDLALAMGLMAFCASSHFRGTRWASLPLIALLAGIAASLLSGSRGGWIALLFVIVPIIRYGREWHGKLILYGYLLALLLVGVVIVVPETGVADRIGLAVAEVHAYTDKGDATTSTGIRLELWKASWLMFVEHPMLGVGRDQFVPALHALAAQNRIQQSPALAFASSHSDTLFFLATGGLLDFSFLLLIYLGPLAVFLSVLKKNPHSTVVPLSDDVSGKRAAALAGILLVISYIAFGLTDVMFWLMMPTAFYVIMVCALLGFCLQVNAPVGARCDSNGVA